MMMEKAMASYSSTLAWKTPWMEEPGRLQPMWSQRVGHDWATSLSLFTFMHWRRKWQSTPVFLPRESQGWGSLVGCRLWGPTESDMTEATLQQQQQQTHDDGKGNDTPLQYSCLENPMDGGAWKAAVHVVSKSWTRLSNFTFTFHFHALEKEMATHSSVLAWRIPGTGESGGLPSTGSHRVRHDWNDLAVAIANTWW